MTSRKATKKVTKATARPAAKKVAKRVAKKVPRKTVAESVPESTVDVVSRVRGAKASVAVGKAGGRPMLSWVGKRAPASVQAFPAQWVEAYGEEAPGGSLWSEWPDDLRRGGLLYHGDNKDVLAHLLANGFRGQVKLIYIDPPFDSGADYVRHVELRGPKGSAKLMGESYSLGEQIQYADIWANDSYLQFMYERLLLLKSLLAPDGSIWLHCDWHRSHQLRMLLDEVFGSTSIKNEVIWQRTDPHNDAKSRLGWVHDSIFWYSQAEKPTYNWRSVVQPLSTAALKEYSLAMSPEGRVVAWSDNLPDTYRRFKLDDCTYKGSDPSRRFVWRGAAPSNKRVWPYATASEMDDALERGEFYLRNSSVGAARCRVSFLENREGQVLQTIWTDTDRMKGGSQYPTEKPEGLLDRIISACSNPGDLVLDCFVGSGTAAVVAQALGRRWIGCDINKGAIQTTAKRLQLVIQEQADDGGKPAQGKLLGEDEAPPPAQLGFCHWRVNDYDLAIQHNEAVSLACEYLGVERLRSDAYFDGLLGRRLVKIIPFGHPLSPIDLEAIRNELDARPDEDRAITVVCLGKELASDVWLTEWNRLRKKKTDPHHIEVIELRSDPKYGGFIQHEKAQARVLVKRKDGKLHVEIKDFVSPGILQRLAQQSGVVQAKVADWRAMVDSVMIDTAFDGAVLNVAHADVPARKTDFVVGEYKLDAPEGETTVAVKITDMLGEEVLVTQAA